MHRYRCTDGRCSARIAVAAVAGIVATSCVGRSLPVAMPAAGLHCVAPQIDTTAGFVYGSLVPEKPGDPVDRRELTTALGRLSAALMDDTLTLPPVARMSDIVVTAVGLRAAERPPLVPRWPGHPALATEIALTLDASGSMSDPRVITRGDSAVSAALMRAIAKLPSAADGAVAQGSQRLRLRFGLRPDSPAVSVPLVAARQLSIEATPPRLRSGQVAPIFPRPKPSQGAMRAIVLAWYTVDARGSAVESSFGAAPVTDPASAPIYEDFVDAVRVSARKMRHDPAIAGGCTVPLQGVVHVEFDIERRGQ